MQRRNKEKIGRKKKIKAQTRKGMDKSQRLRTVPYDKRQRCFQKNGHKSSMSRQWENKQEGRNSRQYKNYST